MLTRINSFFDFFRLDDSDQLISRELALKATERSNGMMNEKDYEALAAAGAIMGSGGLVVLDDSDCMVDIARYFLRFTQDQSCGKCTFCRVGTRRMLDILDRLCAGQGRKGDLES